MVHKKNENQNPLNKTSFHKFYIKIFSKKNAWLRLGLLGEGGGSKLIGTTNFLETEIDKLQLAILKEDPNKCFSLSFRQIFTLTILGEKKTCRTRHI